MNHRLIRWAEKVLRRNDWTCQPRKLSGPELRRQHLSGCDRMHSQLSIRVLIDADLIKFDHGNSPGPREYWHTERDTLDKIGPHSLEIVGQTTLRLIELLENQAAGH